MLPSQSLNISYLPYFHTAKIPAVQREWKLIKAAPFPPSSILHLSQLLCLHHFIHFRLNRGGERMVNAMDSHPHLITTVHYDRERMVNVIDKSPHAYKFRKESSSSQIYCSSGNNSWDLNIVHFIFKYSAVY